MSNSLEFPRNCFLITSLYKYSFLEARASGIRNFIYWFAVIKLLYFLIFNVVQFRYLVLQVAQSTVYTNLSLTFFLHVSTSTRPSSGRYIQQHKSTAKYFCLFCGPCIVIYPYNKNQSQSISNINFYMFRAGLLLIIRRYFSVYTAYTDI
jgi:hypothetical protein